MRCWGFRTTSRAAPARAAPRCSARSSPAELGRSRDLIVDSHLSTSVGFASLRAPLTRRLRPKPLVGARRPCELASGDGTKTGKAPSHRAHVHLERGLLPGSLALGFAGLRF